MNPGPSRPLPKQPVVIIGHRAVQTYIAVAAADIAIANQTSTNMKASSSKGRHCRHLDAIDSQYTVPTSMALNRQKVHNCEICIWAPGCMQAENKMLRKTSTRVEVTLGLSRYGPERATGYTDWFSSVVTVGPRSWQMHILEPQLHR